MSNQGKLLKTLTYLGLRFVKSVPWFVIEAHGSKLSVFLSQYCLQKYLVCIGPKTDKRDRKCFNNSFCISFFIILRATKTELAGHIRSVFDTPVIEAHFDIPFSNL